jgi:hypothetical protein
MADGTKLPPMIIFRGTTKRTISGIVVPANKAILQYSKNAWNSAELSRYWIDYIWSPHVQDNHNLLIWDQFSGHSACQFNQMDNHIHRVLVPPSCTPVVQPLDVSLIRAFKCNFRKIQTTWRDRRQGFEIAKPTKQLLVNWIISAWSDVSNAIVRRSFKTCGISNDLDGSEERDVNINVNRLLCN